jgi:hypothetical protein
VFIIGLSFASSFGVLVSPEEVVASSVGVVVSTTPSQIGTPDLRPGKIVL